MKKNEINRIPLKTNYNPSDFTFVLLQKQKLVKEKNILLSDSNIHYKRRNGKCKIQDAGFLR